MTIPEALALAKEHLMAGRLAEADALYGQILAVQPNEFEAWHSRGIVAHQMARYELAEEYLRRAIGLNPNEAAAYSNLGEVYRAAGHPGEAIASYRRALQLQPDHPAILNNLGLALDAKGDLPGAVATYRRALAISPQYAEAHNNLANALASLGQFPEAMAAFQEAIRYQPDFALAYSNMGATLTEHGELDSGAAALWRATKLDPQCADAWNNLGNTLKDQGRIGDAVAAFRYASQVAPKHAGMHSNLVQALQYDPAQDETMIAAEQQQWNRRFVEPLRRLRRPHTNTPDADRPLRIGYVSGDLRDHVVGRNVRPLFQHHDTAQFEIFCYAAVVKADEATDEFRQRTAQWRSTLGVSDASLAEMIRADGVDILVDLSQHTGNNRLATFAYEPAPVQVSFAGYPGDTGVETIGYRITDYYLEGGVHQSQAGAQTNLIDSFWCYDPHGLNVPVSPLPAEQNGRITFGSLNNFCKINEVTLRLWSRVLREVKDSRLMLLSRVGSHRERTLDFLRSEGVSDKRVEFLEPIDRLEYLAYYQRVDIGLDPVPYNGHTTGLDALWMGVPVVSPIGRNTVSRGGFSQSANLGLEELVAFSDDDFVAITVRLASDLPRLAELRRTLRSRMEASPLMDSRRFTRSIESAYRSMWRRWCATPRR